ncbi:3-oxoacyl-[acyl-carrier-protein] reductase [Pseudoflavonifractor sp. AF19-9AC]|uniref:3-oxoacyl-[acyl-carrier-protein] reductase n=1 Tax=Pseudoflavonifractor sp. AF19-9AC TaxID=2292244 RepID=UPI000E5073A1|nr:3-oxoacyl-[acyl-carrier-protein] reductase [Pseudoflavonifractor sp. AF19-9AC]RHR10188.1 3-oxoacyl-[acyl-carrier-protein] reductase [Pseudoflavonifractor sp. AF19-9AC]
MTMKESVALVTGGSRGIGRAICLELARQGASVAVNYAGNEQAALETVEACRALGVEAEAFQADVADPAACEELVKAVKDRFGHLDILVNNAGITRDGLLMTAKAEDFDKVLDTNLKGAYFCMKAASKVMMRQRYGRIISMSSVVGLRGNAGQTSYSASKAGILGLTKSAAKELATRGVTVNAVAPGFIDTDMTSVLPENAKNAMLTTIPMGKPGAPEDVARAVVFFARPESAYITGQVLCVDGGMAV